MDNMFRETDKAPTINKTSLAEPEKKPHAGSAHIPENMRESPVENFDTPLDKAHEQDKISPLPEAEAKEPVYQATDVYTPPKIETGRKLNKKVLAVIGTVAAAATAAGAYFAVTNNQAPQNSPVPVEPGEPNQGGEGVLPPEDGEGTAERTPSEFTDEQLMQLENMKPTPEIQALLDTPSDQLTIEQRLTVGSWINRDNKYLDAQFYKGNDNDVRYLVPDELSATSSPEDIVASNGALISYSFVSHFGGLVYDRDTYQKSLSAAFLSLDSPNYDRWTQALDANTTVPTPGYAATVGSLQLPTQILSDTPSEKKVLEDGVERVTRTITYISAAGGEVTSSYALVDYTDYKGEQKSAAVSITE